MMRVTGDRGIRVPAAAWSPGELLASFSACIPACILVCIPASPPLSEALHLEKGSFRIIPLLAIVIALPGNSLRRKTEAVKDISLMGFVV